MNSQGKLTYAILGLLLLALPLRADYAVTVQNDAQTLFRHPVSLKLDNAQAAFVQEGALFQEETPDGLRTVPYALDWCDDAPRLCWTLEGKTSPRQTRRFVLTPGKALPQEKTDLNCTETEEDILVQNVYFQLRHSRTGKGGFPWQIQYRESGYTDTGLEFYDRLYHRDFGKYWARNDREASSRVVLNTPQRVVIETRTRFIADDGTPSPDSTLAIYRFTYSPHSPVARVQRLLQREDSSRPWTEALFLQVCRLGRLHTVIFTGEPFQSADAVQATSAPRSFHFSQWAVIASPQGAFGLGDTQGNGYDRGNYSFPSYLCARNSGLSEGTATLRQEALLYLGPPREEENWYSRWLGDAQPNLSIEARDPIAPASDDISKHHLTLDCGGLKIHFNSPEAGLGCAGVENLLGETPVRFVFPAQASTPLWRLAFRCPYETRKHEMAKTGAPETLWLTSADATAPVPTVSQGDNGALVFTWHDLDLPDDPGTVDVHCTITPVPGHHEARWRIRVTNRSRKWGLAETRYPMLAQVIRPREGDALLPDSNWGHRLYRSSTAQVEQSYPSYKCMMQFLAFQQGTAGLYFAAHDPGARPKKLIVSEEQDAAFLLLAENSSQPGAGEDDGFDFCLTAYQGDWWKAAKRYRKWATAETPWTAKGPIVSRKDYPKSLVDLSFWMRLDSDRISTDALASQMERLHARIGNKSGLALHWYCWHQIPFDNSYPEYFPVKENFAANVLRLTAQGIPVMPYINARLWDVDIPSFNQEARNAAALPENGELSLETYGSGRFLTPMCPYTALWQEKMYTIALRLMEECKVSGIYLDQIGCAGPEPCFNPAHGHPLGGGTHWADGYRTLLSRIKAKAAETGVFLTMEAGAEPYMDNIDGNLICTQRFQEEVPTLTAVYSGYTIYFSNPGNPHDDLTAFRAAQARDFLWGCQPGWNNAWIGDEAHRDHFAYEAYLGHLQQAAKAFFREGELLCEQPPAAQPGEITVTWHRKQPHQATLQAVQGYWWKAPDGRLLLAVANLAPNVRRFSVENTSLAALSGAPVSQMFLAERLTETGSAPLRQCPAATFSHHFTLEPGEVFLTTFTPVTRKTLKNAYGRAQALVNDDTATPELRNAAAEYLFHTDYGVEFLPATELSGVPGSAITFDCDLAGKLDKRFRLLLPDGLERSVRPGKLQVQLTIPHRQNTSAETAWCELHRDDLAWRIPVAIRPLPSLEIAMVRPEEVRAGKDFLLEMKVANHQGFPATGLIRLNLPQGWMAEPSNRIPFDALPPGESLATTVRIQVPEGKQPTTPFLTAEVLSAQTLEQLTVLPPRPQLSAPRATKPIDLTTGENWPEGEWAILGKTSQKGVKIPQYAGEADCSGRLRCAWDDNCLYVQAEVTDNLHFQNSPNEKLWTGDCVQLALHPGPAKATQGYDGTEREIGLALTNEGFAFAYQWMGGKNNGLLENARLDIRREENRTIYRAALPWSTLRLPPPNPEDTLSFSFTFNDNDAKGLRGWLEWTPGVCGGKDSSQFGELLFQN